jgi:hypothetical protein
MNEIRPRWRPSTSFSLQSSSVILSFDPAPTCCFTPISFTLCCFDTPSQFTPLLNLRSRIFGLTPFGWLLSITPYFWWEYNFDLSLFLFTSTFSGMQPVHKTRARCVVWIPNDIVKLTVNKVLRRQNSVKCSRADSRVKMWFSDVSGTYYVPIFTPEGGDGVTSRNVWKPRLDAAVCPRTFQCR